jgi:glutamate mutase epsilon subunit
VEDGGSAVESTKSVKVVIEKQGTIEMAAVDGQSVGQLRSELAVRYGRNALEVRFADSRGELGDEVPVADIAGEVRCVFVEAPIIKPTVE